LPACGEVIKPNVVLFGENINNYLGARQLILDARLLIVIGSSLTVYPLAGFVNEFCGFAKDLESSIKAQLSWTTLPDTNWMSRITVG
jgi:NAD-dependent SIR2 family protein deacetylase